ncbi:uncharacterized protein LOC113336636 [Papaver somniferum]|uniref:uncharacterized protein LOC113336636 n=1 Tax=Papaver somniferum TaxID=3469 RepID=UPI000E6FAF4E|nr:uncharacterized protein LOC113336636 [Papaver somniferum]
MNNTSANLLCAKILKVHNTQSAIQRFEECRYSVRILTRCNTSKNPRCVADGNEQLRFHCTNLTCSLDSSICNLAVPGYGPCGVFFVLRHGFPAGKGVCTKTSSVKAHSGFGSVGWDNTRAMLVCRVIAGRINEANGTNVGVAAETYDVVGAGQKAYSTYEELFVSNPEVVLPCFVIVYSSQ